MARRPDDGGGRGAGFVGCGFLCALSVLGLAGLLGGGGVGGEDALTAEAGGVWRVDVNGASAAELSVLPGIGPSLAGRIVELRERRGGFGRVEELDDVRGIGVKRLAGVRPWVRVGEGEGWEE